MLKADGTASEHLEKGARILNSFQPRVSAEPCLSGERLASHVALSSSGYFSFISQVPHGKESGP